VLNPANTSRDVDLDKDYLNAERAARLTQAGWRLHIQRKAPRGKPLSNCQKRRNTRIARTRARVEHVFASLAQMGGKGLRCIGLARANLHLHWKAAAYNLRRLCSLKACGVAAF
jgi:IS5 family transposase